MAPRKINVGRLVFDAGAFVPGDPGFAGPGAGAAGVGASAGPPQFPGTGGAYGPPGGSAAGRAGRAAYAAFLQQASAGMLTPFGSERGPGGGPAFPGGAVLPAATFGGASPSLTPTVRSERGLHLPIVGAANLLRPGYGVHRVPTTVVSPSQAPVAGVASVLESSGAISAAQSLGSRLSSIGRLGAGLIGYEASKSALEKIAHGEIPTLPELTALATFSASLYLLAPEEGLGWVATSLGWLSTIGRGLIKAGEVAAATEAIDIGDRIVSDVTGQSGRLLEQKAQTQPAPVPAVPSLAAQLASPGPSVPLPPTPQQIAAEQAATRMVAQQPEPSQVPPGVEVTQPVLATGQPLTAQSGTQPLAALQGGQPLTIPQQTHEIQRLMEQQSGTTPTGGQQIIPSQSGTTPIGGQPEQIIPPQFGQGKTLPFEHQPGGCYSAQQMEELVSCSNFQKALTDHFEIRQQPGGKPQLTPKIPVCVCCDSAADLTEYVDSGGIRGACVQVQGLSDVHPQLGGG